MAHHPSFLVDKLHESHSYPAGLHPIPEPTETSNLLPCINTPTHNPNFNTSFAPELPYGLNNFSSTTELLIAPHGTIIPLNGQTASVMGLGQCLPYADEPCYQNPFEHAPYGCCNAYNTSLLPNATLLNRDLNSNGNNAITSEHTGNDQLTEIPDPPPEYVIPPSPHSPTQLQRYFLPDTDTDTVIAILNI